MSLPPFTQDGTASAPISAVPRSGITEAASCSGSKAVICFNRLEICATFPIFNLRQPNRPAKGSVEQVLALGRDEGSADSAGVLVSRPFRDAPEQSGADPTPSPGWLYLNPQDFTCSVPHKARCPAHFTPVDLCQHGESALRLLSYRKAKGILFEQIGYQIASLHACNYRCLVDYSTGNRDSDILAASGQGRDLSDS